VVYSEFFCTLDVLSVALLESGYGHLLRFDGSVGLAERDQTVRAFQNDQKHRILLVTNRSGGPGRSSTAANAVMHLTPYYNPGLTMQCTNSVIRDPQKKTVYVYYLHAEDLIELRVLEIQRRKQGKAVNQFDSDEVMTKEIDKVKD
jgi:SWI/SNF-related matrix-associated actin-dependent regulator of chromatin subfamily A3